MKTFRTILRYLFFILNISALSACGGGSGGSTSNSTNNALAVMGCSPPTGIFNGSCTVAQQGASGCSEIFGIEGVATVQIQTQCTQQGGTFSNGRCPANDIMAACKMTTVVPSLSMDTVMYFYSSSSGGMTPQDVEQMCTGINDPDNEFTSTEFCE